MSRVQLPGFRVQRPECSVQSPASNSCTQSPGIPVFLETLIPKGIRFWQVLLSESFVDSILVLIAILKMIINIDSDT